MQIDTRHFQACHFDARAAGFPRGTAAGWFRLFGYGVKWRLNHPDNPRWLYFSERHGFTKVVRIGRLVLGTLTPDSNAKEPT